MASDWSLWRQEIKSPTPEERREDRPVEPSLLNGFWRSVGPRTGYDEAIVINEGRWAKGSFTVWKTIADDQKAWSAFIRVGWLKCIAVSREEIAQAINTGRWSDGKPSRSMTPEEKLDVEVATGGNNPPVEESLADQIKTLAEKIDKISEPTTQAEANALAGELDRMRLLLNRAEEQRKLEKEPHLRAGQEVDARWKAIGEPGGNAYRAGEARKKAWLRKEQQRLDAEARAEAQRLREAAQAEADAKTAATNQQAEQMGMEAEPAPQVEAPKVEPKRATAGTAYGTQRGLKKVKVAVIDDLPKLVNALLWPGEGVAVDQETVDFFQGKADRALKGGITLPGVKVGEEYR